MSDSRRPFFLALFVVLVVFIPCVGFDFVGWDDALFLTANPRFNPPTIGTVGYYWTHAGQNLYMPVTYTVWAAVAAVTSVGTPDAAGSRLNPFAFHLAGLVCHLVATAAVFGLLKTAVRSPAAAAVGAIAFAVHPLQVESVAFVGTMNTPLAAALGLSAAWLHVTGGKARRVFAVVLYALAVLAKPTAVVVPAVAVALERAAGRKFFPSLRAISPWLIVAVPCIVWTAAIQKPNPGAVTEWPARLRLAGDAVSFYLAKVAVPFDLGVDHGRTPAWVLGHPRAIGTALIPVGLVLLLITPSSTPVLRYPEEPDMPRENIRPFGVPQDRRRRIFLPAAALFIITALPNSGIVPFDYQRISNVADRYAYLPMVAVGLAVAAFAAVAPNKIARFSIIAVLSFWSILTEIQLHTWRDGVAVFSRAVAVNPDSWYAHALLAQAELSADDPAAALAAATRAIRLYPTPVQTDAARIELARVRVDRGVALDRLNRLPEALAAFQTAAATNPADAGAAANVGILLGRLGQPDRARIWFRRALAIDPTLPEARDALRTINHARPVPSPGTPGEG